MNERCRLHRFSVLLPRHTRTRKTPQLRIDERQQLVGRLPVAGLDLSKKQGHALAWVLTHEEILPNCDATGPACK